MAKTVADSVLDAALNKTATATIMTVCSAAPTSRTEAVTTYALADVTMAGGDFTVVNGDTSGRKVTVAQKTGVTVDTSGTPTHVALCDATTLLLVTECSGPAGGLSQGSTVDFPAFDQEIADPT